MAFDVGGGKAAVRPSMNVTPLVDVVLVLLIIFMVITPLLAKQFWLHVPKKDKEEKVEPPKDAPPPVVVMVNKDGQVQVGPEKVVDAAFGEKLRRIFAARHENVFFCGAAPVVRFGRAWVVLDIARGGSALTIAVMTDPPQQ
jgi:biopolymer transport protein ExbD